MTMLTNREHLLYVINMWLNTQFWRGQFQPRPKKSWIIRDDDGRIVTVVPTPPPSDHKEKKDGS